MGASHKLSMWALQHVVDRIGEGDQTVVVVGEKRRMQWCAHICPFNHTIQRVKPCDQQAVQLWMFGAMRFVHRLVVAVVVTTSGSTPFAWARIVSNTSKSDKTLEKSEKSGKMDKSFTNNSSIKKTRAQRPKHLGLSRMKGYFCPTSNKHWQVTDCLRLVRKTN